MAHSGIVRALQRGDIHRAVMLAQRAVRQEPRVALEMIQSADPADRPLLVTLLRDVITDYPRTLIGAPVLLRWSSARDILELPVPDSLDPNPDEGLEFVAWLPHNAYIPAELPAPGDPPTTVTIATHCIQCAIAVFRAAADAPDPADHDIEHAWWATLFSATPLQDTVYLSARMLLPYPDALEAARVLYSTATAGKPPVQRAAFLTDHAWAWAVDAGLQYRTHRSES